MIAGTISKNLPRSGCRNWKRRSAAKVALATSAEPPKTVAMHPKVVDQYIRDLDQLDHLIADDLTAGNDGLAKGPARNRYTVCVIPTARQPFEIGIKGYLDTLLTSLVRIVLLPVVRW